MKIFKTIEEEQKYWLELAHSKFWEGLLDLIEDRIGHLENALDDPRVPRGDDSRLFGRLSELRWLKKLPEALLNSVEMANIANQKEDELQPVQRLVGNPDKSTGII